MSLKKSISPSKFCVRVSVKPFVWWKLNLFSHWVINFVFFIFWDWWKRSVDCSLLNIRLKARSILKCRELIENFKIGFCVQSKGKYKSNGNLIQRQFYYLEYWVSGEGGDRRD